MIYYSRLHPSILKSDIFFAKSRKGLCFISFNKNENEFLKQFAKSHDEEVIFAPKMLHKESGQIKRFLEGKRKTFTLRTDINGSSFQLSVKEIKALRAVANACGRNPLPIVIPCHRIVAKDGSLGGYTGGLEIKRNLLRIENSL